MAEDLFEHHRFVVDEGQAPMRLDSFLSLKLGGISRNRIQIGIKAGGVHINGKEILKSSYSVKPKDVAQVMLPNPPRLTTIKGENIPLRIVHEDRDILVVYKPADMVVHPAHGNWDGTLVNALIYKFEQLPYAVGNEGRPGLLHRIDKGTSGLLVVAKSEEALSSLAKQFAAHTVERQYYALIWGTPQATQGTIATRIGRSQGDRRRMAVYPDDSSYGKDAITHYQVEEELGYVTLISCRLETGRTHQIRVHLAHIGHPLFGDTRYGGDRIVVGPPYAKYRSFIAKNFSLLPHQALHAATLGFIHPRTGEKVTFTDPLPDAFNQVITRWRRFATAHNYA